LAGERKRDYGKRAKPLSVTHTLIAATALHNRLVLLTDNT
jgi:predicted nucleic acid-binding protein